MRRRGRPSRRRAALPGSIADAGRRPVRGRSNRLRDPRLQPARQMPGHPSGQDGTQVVREPDHDALPGNQGSSSAMRGLGGGSAKGLHSRPAIGRPPWTAAKPRFQSGPETGAHLWERSPGALDERYGCQAAAGRSANTSVETMSPVRAQRQETGDAAPIARSIARLGPVIRRGKPAYACEARLA
jgi:hypothetical protein